MEFYIPLPKNKDVFDEICRPIINRRNYIRKVNKVIDSLDDVSTALQLGMPNIEEPEPTKREKPLALRGDLDDILKLAVSKPKK